MGAGILWMCLVLMAIVGVNQPLLPSGKNSIVPEGGEEIAQRMKERELSLRLHQLRWEKEMANVEAQEEAVAWPAWEAQREIQLHRDTQLHTWTVFSLVIPALFLFWWQHWRGAPAEPGREEAEPTLLGRAWKGVAFLAKPFVQCRGIAISMDRSVGDLDYWQGDWSNYL